MRSVSLGCEGRFFFVLLLESARVVLLYEPGLVCVLHAPKQCKYNSCKLIFLMEKKIPFNLCHYFLFVILFNYIKCFLTYFHTVSCLNISEKLAPLFVMSWDRTFIRALFSEF
jgi:hypothetical protein